MALDKTKNKSLSGKEIDSLEERYDIEAYLEHFGHTMDESPINSVSKKTSVPGENISIPDAIFSDKKAGKKKGLEHTRIAGSQEEHELRGDLRKKKEKFAGKTFIEHPPRGNLLRACFNAINKKMKKDYGPFIQLAGVEKRLVLLLISNDLSPFPTEASFSNFINIVRENCYFRSSRLPSSCFGEVVFGEWVRQVDNKWIFRFETIWSLTHRPLNYLPQDLEKIEPLVPCR